MGFTRALGTACCSVVIGALLLASAPLAVADQVRDNQWALEALNAESVWALSKGDGVTVAVIDDGVKADHIDLQGNVLEGKDFMNGGSTYPENGDDHGTAMASIIAAHGHDGDEGVIGLAPEAKILPVRAFGTDGPGTDVAIRYAVDQGASVINVSMCFNSTSQDELDEVSNAVTYALKRDVLVVGAAGNEEDKGGECYPAASPGALGVGAVKNDGYLWEGSNKGPFVSLVSPGKDIISAKGDSNGYRVASGTSDGAAYVTAAAALIRANFPDLTAGQVANRLVETAVLPDSEKGLSLPDEGYGYGIIQPLAALKDDIPAGSKYGPLTVPESLKDHSSVSGAETSDRSQEEANRKAMLIWVIIGVLGLAFLALVVFLVVKRSRKNRNSDGGSGGQPPVVQQFIAPQQNPYKQPVQQQQNPYYQQPPAPPQGQWPPRQ